MNDCVWLGKDAGRVLPGEHENDCDTSGCPGCTPCGARHCTGPGCRGRHLGESESLTCASCVGSVRDDLAAIVRLSGWRLDVEAADDGVSSTAAMLAGPTADVEAWRHREASAIAGRVDGAYLADCWDEPHPAWVAETWAYAWRAALGHETEERQTLEKAVTYLNLQLSYMAQRRESDFPRFAREINGCRVYIENVVSEGIRAEKGAPCPMCGGKALVKRYGDTVADDRWTCPRPTCGATYTEHDYRAKVEAAYLYAASALPASHIHAAYRVPERTVRHWAKVTPPRVRTRGKDDKGRQLYDVADVLAARDALARDIAG